MLNDDASNHASEAHDEATDGTTPIRRGRGRPPGSPNKPKAPPMSPIERQALKEELGAVYRQAIIDRALVETRTRGLTSLIQAKLGKEGLAEIQAEVAREHEMHDAAAVDVGDDARSQRLAA